MSITDQRPYSEPTVDAVCDCVSASVAMGWRVDGLPASPAGRRDQIDRWREAATTSETAFDGDDGTVNFLRACELLRGGHGSDAALAALTLEPRLRQRWRHRLQPIGGYVLVVWGLGLAVWTLVCGSNYRLLSEHNDALRPLRTLPSHGGRPSSGTLWGFDALSTPVLLAGSVLMLAIGIGLWWPLLQRIVSPHDHSPLQPGTRLQRDRWLAAILPVGLILLLAGPLVVAVMLSLFVPLLQFYHHLSGVMAS